MSTQFNIGSSDINDGKPMGGFSYLFEPIGFIIALITSRQNKYVMFHAQQALLIMIIWVALNLFWVASVIPIIGWIIDVCIILADITLIVLWVIGIINGFSGNVTPVPIIGEFAYKLGLLKPEDPAYSANIVENKETMN